jgi:hypothetical protein
MDRWAKQNDNRKAHNFVVKTAHIGLRSVSNCTHVECDTDQAVWHLLGKLIIRNKLMGLKPIEMNRVVT